VPGEKVRGNGGHPKEESLRLEGETFSPRLPGSGTDFSERLCTLGGFPDQLHKALSSLV